MGVALIIGMITESMCTYILKEMGIESRCLNVASKTLRRMMTS